MVTGMVSLRRTEVYYLVKLVTGAGLGSGVQQRRWERRGRSAGAHAVEGQIRDLHAGEVAPCGVLLV